MPGISSRSIALIGLVWLAGVPGTSVWAEPPASPVRLEIVEGLPKDWDWSLPEGAVVEPVEGRALAFPSLPAKYNDHGIAIDRKAPFALHAEATLEVPDGPQRLILRSRGAARLLVDGQVVAETDPIRGYGSGHEHVPEVPPPDDPRWRYVATGEQERIIDWESDGQPHKVELWAVIGSKHLRPETGELSVSIAAPGEVPTLIGSPERVELTNAGWEAFAESERQRIVALDTTHRRAAAAKEAPYWEHRHAIARRIAEEDGPTDPPGEGNLIDRYLEAAGAEPPVPLDDAAFYRRLSIDTTGVIPEAAEVAAFLNDDRPDKRARAIDDRLNDPRWADAWMGYWQDALAENPGILKPTLNNTGPFRYYLHTALRDNLPFDRLVTDLVRLEGSTYYGGPAGFGISTQNDAPMVARTHVLAKAFLAVEMKCARCHDAPFHPFAQADLFGIAGLFARKPLKVPATSTVPVSEGARPPAVPITLHAGETVEPSWSLADLTPDGLPDGLLPEGADDRDRLAALVTSPTNARFAPVAANRLFQRFIGVGLVESVDDWDSPTDTHQPELLAALARELMTHGYDLKHVARIILNSRLYQGQVTTNPPEDGEPITAPIRRRMSAEQLLDSLFAAAGKDFHSEALCMDPEGRRPASVMLNFGVPRHAWELTSLSNERDRPALSLPVAQSLVDVLKTFGWRPTRQDPLTIRDEATTPLQPAILTNGVVVTGRIARLSDDSALTELCLVDQPAEELVRRVFERVLSREPTADETTRLVAYLGSSYNDRVIPGAKPNPPRRFARRVSWSNHLSPEATEIQLARERAVLEGDPPSARLKPMFRERMEDVVWALVNSPEFVFIP